MYLNVVQLAESFGVAEGVVEEWVRNEGLPCVPERGRLLFERVRVVEWAASRGLVTRAGFLAPEQPLPATGQSLLSLLRRGGIWREVPGAEVLDVLERVVTALPGATLPIRQVLTQRLRAPQGITWAPVGEGFALPHLRAPVVLGRDSGLVALVLLRDPLPLAEPPPDAVPVTRLLFFIAPSPRAHLELLAQLSVALTRGALGRLARAGASDAELYAEVTGKGTGP
jgi:PTS system nitrogen regulatory IIA component